MTHRRDDRLLTIDAIVQRRMRREPPERRIEEPHRAARRRAALHVVIRGGELNQSLKKLFFVALRREPDLLPRFMRVPETLRVEQLDAALEKRGTCNEERVASRWLHSFLASRSSFRRQSDALVPLRNTSHIADVKSVVEPVPPMSRVRLSGPMASTFPMASSTRFAAPPSPM